MKHQNRYFMKRIGSSFSEKEYFLKIEMIT